MLKLAASGGARDGVLRSAASPADRAGAVRGWDERIKVLAGILATIAWSLASAAALAQPDHDPARYNGFDVRGSTIPVEAIERGGPPRDGIPAIDHPRFVTAAQSGLADRHRVLAIEHNGLARAYPVRILNWHEVVNDRFGRDAVVVTYCPLCGTGMSFLAKGDGAKSSFGVSGLLYNSDVLLYDRGTQSLWSQIAQVAVSGPRRGERLEALPTLHTTWADWRRRHPETEVLSTDTGFARDYGRDPYAGYGEVQRLMFNVGSRDDRLSLKEWVIGLEIDGIAKAYPFALLARRAGADGIVDDTIGPRRVRIRFDRVHRTAEAFDADGRPLPGLVSYWFAWVAFHPKTEIWR